MNLTETATNNIHECTRWCKERSIATAALGTTAIAVAILGATIAVLAATGNLEGVIQFAANAWQMPAVRIALFAGAGFVAAAVVTYAAIKVYKPQKTLDMSKVNFDEDPLEELDVEQQLSPSPVKARTPSSIKHKKPPGPTRPDGTPRGRPTKGVSKSGTPIEEPSPNANGPLPTSPNKPETVSQPDLVDPKSLANPTPRQIEDFHDVAHQGNVAKMEEMLDAGMPLKACCEYGDTAMHCAAYSDKVLAIEFLLSRGANENVGNKKGETPLHSAAQGNAFNVIACLVKANDVLLQAKNIQGETAMHAAAEGGSVDVLKELHRLGAVVDEKNSSEKTPLHKAAESGKRKAVVALLEMEADREAKDKLGRTPAGLVQEWIKDDKKNEKILEALKETQTPSL